ncbi:MAG TPA: hypothetical protein VIO64_06130 [Pseudobacteroides sp.]|uniref:hypothetical protein n=1 Tax=Pseudobacteroides sp. TaxID=1968840 RepID=UPI002F958850
MKKFRIAGVILLAACLALSSIGCGAIDKEEVGKGEIISSDKTGENTDSKNDETPSEKPEESSSNEPSAKPSEKADDSTGKKLDLGKNEGDTYKNEFFGLSMKLPKDWKVSSDEEKQKVLNAGKEAIAGDDKSKQTQLDLADLKSVYLLMVSKIGMTNQSYDNGNLMIMAEKLSLLQGVNKGSQYLEYVKKGLKELNGQMPYKLDKDVYEEKIGGKVFSVLETVIESPDIKLTQKYYACVLKGYALVFITTSTNNENDKIIKGMLDSVKFE